MTKARINVLAYAEMLAHLKHSQATVEELSEVCGLSYRAVKAFVELLNKPKRRVVVIVDWEIRHSVRIPIYSWWQEGMMNKAKPVALSKAERARRSRAKKKLALLDPIQRIVLSLEGGKHGDAKTHCGSSQLSCSE